MKTEQELDNKEPENDSPIVGDVIGDTAYSERFVLKILLKLANLDTLKDEVQEKTFEDDLCTLWDMTAERDVVLFLLKHDILNLLNFALPVIESPRIIEILVGFTGNMCCHKEVVALLMKMSNFLSFLMEYTKTDDSLILVQVLRLISSCLFLADSEEVAIWMDTFKNIEYSTALYFILKNSANRELLVTALENFNTLCSYCNVENYRVEFYTHFVTSDALDSLITGVLEIIVNQKESCETEELERILVVSLQITLNLIGFDKCTEMYNENKENISSMIKLILNYYENKLVNEKEIDGDLADVIDSTNTIINTLQLSKMCDLDKYFSQTYSMWRTICIINKGEKNGSASFEDDKEELKDLTKQIKPCLCTLLCSYIKDCSDNNLLKVMDVIREDYEDILGLVKDKGLRTEVSKKTANYRIRLKENVDS